MPAALKIGLLISFGILIGRELEIRLIDQRGPGEPDIIAQGDTVDVLSFVYQESPESLRTRLVLEEASRQGVSPKLMLAISRVENWGGDTLATSRAGALGLMQVMPFWANSVTLTAYCNGNELRNPRINVCFGTAIFRMYLSKYEGNISKALRAYNGSLHLPRAGARYVQLVNSQKENIENG